MHFGRRSVSEDTSELVAGAHAAFETVVHDLIGLRPDTIERDDFGPEHIVRDSLYTELCDARHGEQLGDATRQSAAASRAPGWMDAISLVVRIDQRVASWCPDVAGDEHGTPITVRRLHAAAHDQGSRCMGRAGEDAASDRGHAHVGATRTLPGMRGNHDAR